MPPEQRKSYSIAIILFFFYDQLLALVPPWLNIVHKYTCDIFDQSLSILGRQKEFNTRDTITSERFRQRIGISKLFALNTYCTMHIQLCLKASYRSPPATHPSHQIQSRFRLSRKGRFPGTDPILSLKGIVRPVMEFRLNEATNVDFFLLQSPCSCWSSGNHTCIFSIIPSAFDF